jgi:hypothetical protein
VLQRVAGFGALGAGVIFGTWAIRFLMNPATMGPEVVARDSRLGSFAVLAFGVVLLALGAVLLRARSYRPDLGDSLAAGHDLRATSPTDSHRRWWTGDPIE